MKKSFWCTLFGCHLVILRQGFPYEERWSVRCTRSKCCVGTISVKGSPWRYE